MQDGQGEQAPQPRKSPIDPVHLARQAQGDPALEQEVLELFLAQAIAVRDELKVAVDDTARRQLAHSLVGSARAVGAFDLADCAQELEAGPHTPALMERLGVLVEEVRDFVANLERRR